MRWRRSGFCSTLIQRLPTIRCSFRWLSVIADRSQRVAASALCYMSIPNYPDWPDVEMNLRHDRMMEIRHNFLGHSCIEGSKVFLLSPGSKHPATGVTMTMYYYAVAKRQFLRREFSAWLYQVTDALFRRLDEDIRTLAKEIGIAHLKEPEIYEFDTGVDAFTFAPP